VMNENAGPRAQRHHLSYLIASEGAVAQPALMINANLIAERRTSAKPSRLKLLRAGQSSYFRRVNHESWGSRLGVLGSKRKRPKPTVSLSRFHGVRADSPVGQWRKSASGNAHPLKRRNLRPSCRPLFQLNSRGYRFLARRLPDSARWPVNRPPDAADCQMAQ